MIAAAHDAGLVVHAFTFRNDASLYGFSDPIAEYKAYGRMGIDGVFSDFPDTALAAQAFERLTAAVVGVPIAGPGAEGIRPQPGAETRECAPTGRRGFNRSGFSAAAERSSTTARVPASRITAADRQRLVHAANNILMGL